MIRRLYVDNFRSLVDFTWEPGAETLVLGYNGSGKTSALEVIEIIQRVCGESVRLDFEITSGDRTSWRDAPLIKFEIDSQAGLDLYRYSLSVGFFPGKDLPLIVDESLFLNDRQLFIRGDQKVQMSLSEPGNAGFFPISETQSVIAVVGNGPGGEAIVPFRKSLQDILYLKPLPFFMDARLSGPNSTPEASMAYLVPWYVHLALDESVKEAVFDLLHDVWPELVEIRTPELSKGIYDFILRVRKDGSAGVDLDVPIRAMSDGERMLVALYVVAAYQKTHAPTTIIIDEPDNFVSLREIQPWLLTVLDDRPDGGQLILVSHNPEIIQTMGPERVAYFWREDHLSPTKVSPLPPDEGGLSLSELLARGWIDV